MTLIIIITTTISNGGDGCNAHHPLPRRLHVGEVEAACLGSCGRSESRRTPQDGRRTPKDGRWTPNDGCRTATGRHLGEAAGEGARPSLLPFSLPSAFILFLFPLLFLAFPPLPLEVDPYAPSPPIALQMMPDTCRCKWSSGRVSDS